MSLIKIITNVWSWFKKTVIDHVQSSANVAVTITEAIKSILANPVTGVLENIADAVTGTQIPTNLADGINAVIQKVLAVELGIVGLPSNPTEADVLAFEQRILSSFNISNNNSKLYTELGAQIYGVIQSSIQNGKTSFADWVIDIENIYVQYKLDLAANATPSAPIITENPVLAPATAPAISADTVAAK